MIDRAIVIAGLKCAAQETNTGRPDGRRVELTRQGRTESGLTKLR